MLVQYTEVITDASGETTTMPYSAHEMPDGCFPRKGEFIDDGMSWFEVTSVVWVMAPVRHQSDPDLIVFMRRVGASKLNPEVRS